MAPVYFIFVAFLFLSFEQPSKAIISHFGTLELDFSVFSHNFIVKRNAV